MYYGYIEFAAIYLDRRIKREERLETLASLYGMTVSQYCGRFEFIDNGDDNLVPYFQMTVPERYLRKSEDLDDLITRVVQTASIREDEIRLMTYRKEVGPSRIKDLCKLISGRMVADDDS